MARSFESSVVTSSSRGTDRSILETNPKIVIAIDYGTTFSAVAYCLLPADTRPRVIEDWPGRSSAGRRRVEETPTIIMYYKDSSGRQYKLGYEVNNVLKSPRRPRSQITQPISFAKLLLDETYRSQDYKDTVRTALHTLNLEEVTIHEDILRGLYQHAKTRIDVQNPRQMTSQSTFECAICVPAVWSPAANRTVMEAAQRAGLPNPYLVSEPEAAAAFVIMERKVANLQVYLSNNH